MRWALAEISSRPVSIPRSASAFISPSRTPASMTTPLPMTGVQPGVKTPEGSRWRAYLSPSTTMVCPALLPPW